MNSCCKKQYREILCIIYPVSPKGNTLQSYSTLSQPGKWHWYNQDTEHFYHFLLPIYSHTDFPLTPIHTFSSLQFSRSGMSNSLRPHGPQHNRPACPSPTPGVYWNSCPLIEIGDAIQPSHPLSSPSSPAFNFSQHQGLFKWVSSSNQVAKVLEFQLQYQSFH